MAATHTHAVRSRAEGDLREQQGRFNRDEWARCGTSVADVSVQRCDAKIAFDGTDVGVHQDCGGLRPSVHILRDTEFAREVPVAAI